jgi:hypothetical protein
MDAEQIREFLRKVLVSSVAQAVAISTGLPDRALAGQTNPIVEALIMGHGQTLTEDLLNYFMTGDSKLIGPGMDLRSYEDEALFNSIVNYVFMVSNLDIMLLQTVDMVPVDNVLLKRSLALGATGVISNIIYDYLKDNFEGQNQLVDLVLNPTDLILA